MGPARKGPDTKTYAGRCAARLRTLRERGGMTVQDVAKLTGRPIRTIYNWEAGIATPALADFPKLAAIFGLESPRSILSRK